jgi:drug/metabolite transporter (DMT)-like permease
MIYLLLSILFSTVTVAFFKWFDLKKVDTLQAIVVNYLTCTLAGCLLTQDHIFKIGFWQTDWFIWICLLGLLFISIFYAIAKTAQTISVAASMVAAKLSVIIPVIFAMLMYGESLSFWQVLGIVLSLVAVYFISTNDNQNTKNLSLLLPAAVFMGSGAIDTLLNYLNKRFIPPYQAAQIVTGTFFMAFIFGSIFMGFLWFKGKEKPKLSNVFWGIMLGIPNYFSMFFLVKTLEEFQGSFIFPINNIGIVAASALVAFLLFKEQLSPKKYIGLALAVLAIALLSFL